MSLDPKVQAALNTLTAAANDLAVALGASTAPVVPAAPWFKPTDAEKAEFAKANAVSLIDLDGYLGANPDGSWPVNTAQKAITPLADKTDEAAILNYAKFGYNANGVRMTWTKQGLIAARAMCDRLEAATTPAQAENVISGAGSLNPKTAQFLVMCYAITGGLFQPFRLTSGSLDGNSSVADASAFITAAPQAGGPGPGVA